MDSEYPEQEDLDFLAGLKDLTVETARDIADLFEGYGSGKVTEMDGGFVLRLATGGWSGNEEMLHTLRNNLFISRYWHSSYRGGMEVYTTVDDLPDHDDVERLVKERNAFKLMHVMAIEDLLSMRRAWHKLERERDIYRDERDRVKKINTILFHEHQLVKGERDGYKHTSDINGERSLELINERDEVEARERLTMAEREKANDSVLLLQAEVMKLVGERDEAREELWDVRVELGRQESLHEHTMDELAWTKVERNAARQKAEDQQVDLGAALARAERAEKLIPFLKTNTAMCHCGNPIINHNEVSDHMIQEVYQPCPCEMERNTLRELLTDARDDVAECLNDAINRKDARRIPAYQKQLADIDAALSRRQG